jgi:hypothetical protein
MPTLKKTTYHIGCDCEWYNNLERVENCTGISISSLINTPTMGLTFCVAKAFHDNSYKHFLVKLG